MKPISPNSLSAQAGVFSGEWNDIAGTATSSEPALCTTSAVNSPAFTLHSGSIDELGVSQHRLQTSAQMASIDTIRSMSKEPCPRSKAPEDSTALPPNMVLSSAPSNQYDEY